jgi:hypothetical protein
MREMKANAFGFIPIESIASSKRNIQHFSLQNGVRLMQEREKQVGKKHMTISQIRVSKYLHYHHVTIKDATLLLSFFMILIFFLFSGN